MKNAKKTDAPRIPLNEIAQRAADDEQTSFNTELFDPLEAAAEIDLRRAMPGVLRRAHIETASRS